MKVDGEGCSWLKSISNRRLEKLINIEGYYLAVFYTKGSCWEYSILLPHGKIIAPTEIYYTSQAAERVGREVINKVLGR